MKKRKRASRERLIERWTRLALDLPAEQVSTPGKPVDIYVQEAYGVARFLELRWKPRENLPGLSSVAATLPLGLAAEIWELAEVGAALQSEVRLANRLDVRRAVDLRNRVLTLLHERVAVVRRAARLVFHAHPGLLRRVTSRYSRNQRTAHRRRAAARADTPPDLSTGSPRPGAGGSRILAQGRQQGVHRRPARR
jgi:hypothetical protein